MPINLNPQSKEHVKALAVALDGEDPAAVEAAFADFQCAIESDIAEQYKQAMEDAKRTGDKTILAQRGFRQLTSAEESYYKDVIQALKERRVMQLDDSFTTVAGTVSTTGDKVMPNTIIDEILKDIATNHPLLGVVKTVNTTYLTTWIKNTWTEQLAAWGDVESEITQKIESGLKTKQEHLNKLSCYAVLSIDMLELGPTFFDAYVRTAIGEVMACALEKGAVQGRGGDTHEPIGLIRDVHEGVSVSTSTGYPEKTATAVTSFSDVAEYGALVAQLAKRENGKLKTEDWMSQLTLVCNTVDYLTKVVPAVTVLNMAAEFVRDRFPIPTNVVTSEYVESGQAVLFVANEYSLFVGGNRGIQYSDEFRFLQDQRVFKCVSYAYGEPDDDKSALLLDISGLEPATLGGAVKVSDVTVSEVKGVVKTKEQQ